MLFASIHLYEMCQSEHFNNHMTAKSIEWVYRASGDNHTIITYAISITYNTVG